MSKLKVLMMVVVALITISIFSLGASCATYDKLIYSVSSDGKVTIIKCDTTATDVIIPAQIQGKPVVKLDGAFKNCKDLESVAFRSYCLFLRCNR